MDALIYISIALLIILLIVYICFYKQINVFIVGITGKKRIQRNLYKASKINDFLIINDIWLPIGENRYKHVDTIIFGNKYIYITSLVKQVGEVKISLDDQKWRVIYNRQLTLIDNPFIYNRRVISSLLNAVNGIEQKDLKSLVVLTKTCTFNPINKNDNEFIVSEKEAIGLINQIEANSNDDIFDPHEIERYCKAFYEYGLKAEKAIKEYKKK